MMDEMKDTLDGLTMQNYRQLQYMAKTHNLPSNVRKVDLIQLIHASMYGSDEHVKKLLETVLENRKLRMQKHKNRITENNILPVQPRSMLVHGKHTGGFKRTADGKICKLNSSVQKQYEQLRKVIKKEMVDAETVTTDFPGCSTEQLLPKIKLEQSDNSDYKKQGIKVERQPHALCAVTDLVFHEEDDYKTQSVKVERQPALWAATDLDFHEEDDYKKQGVKVERQPALWAATDLDFHEEDDYKTQGVKVERQPALWAATDLDFHEEDDYKKQGIKVERQPALWAATDLDFHEEDHYKKQGVKVERQPHALCAATDLDFNEEDHYKKQGVKVERQPHALCAATDLDFHEEDNCKKQDVKVKRQPKNISPALCSASDVDFLLNSEKEFAARYFANPIFIHFPPGSDFGQVPEHMDTALNFVDKDWYFDVVRVRCILWPCSWKGFKIDLEDHIRAAHANEIVYQSKPVMWFSLASLNNQKLWQSRVIDVNFTLYILSLKCQDPDTLKVTLTKLASHKKGTTARISIYDRTTDQCYSWTGKTEELICTMPEDNASFGLEVNLSTLMSNNSSLHLVNGKFVVISRNGFVFHKPKLNKMLLHVYVDILEEPLQSASD